MQNFQEFVWTYFYKENFPLEIVVYHSNTVGFMHLEKPIPIKTNFQNCYAYRREESKMAPPPPQKQNTLYFADLKAFEGMTQCLQNIKWRKLKHTITSFSDTFTIIAETVSR